METVDKTCQFPYLAYLLDMPLGITKSPLEATTSTKIKKIIYTFEINKRVVSQTIIIINHPCLMRLNKEHPKLKLSISLKST